MSLASAKFCVITEETLQTKSVRCFCLFSVLTRVTEQLFVLGIVRNCCHVLRAIHVAGIRCEESFSDGRFEPDFVHSGVRLKSWLVTLVNANRTTLTHARATETINNHVSLEFPVLVKMHRLSQALLACPMLDELRLNGQSFSYGNQDLLQTFALLLRPESARNITSLNLLKLTGIAPDGHIAALLTKGNERMLFVSVSLVYCCRLDAEITGAGLCNARNH